MVVNLGRGRVLCLVLLASWVLRSQGERVRGVSNKGALYDSPSHLNNDLSVLCVTLGSKWVTSYYYTTMTTLTYSNLTINCLSLSGSKLDGISSMTNVQFFTIHCVCDVINILTCERKTARPLYCLYRQCNWQLIDFDNGGRADHYIHHHHQHPNHHTHRAGLSVCLFIRC